MHLRARHLLAATVVAALVGVAAFAAFAGTSSGAPPVVPQHSSGTFTLDMSAGQCDTSVDPTLPACWTCTYALDVDQATILVNQDTIKEGVRFAPGCTGRIGKLTVITQGGDAVKSIKGAHDLVVGSGSITCNEPSGAFATDQYGIRAFGGNRITYSGMYVNCRTSNSRIEFFVNQVPTRASGAPAADAPNRILFVQGCLASGPHNTAYLGTSTNSGIGTSVLHEFTAGPPGPPLGPTYSIPAAPSGGGPAASNPLNFDNDLPAGQSSCASSQG